MSFKAVIGLGNCGSCYKNTRHNIGFEILDAFSDLFSDTPWMHEKHFGMFIKKCVFNGKPLVLLKTDGFMNNTGIPLKKVCSFFKIHSSEVVVICDDFTLPLCSIKLTNRAGTAGHNGVDSILRHLGPGFVRFRVGIDQKPIKQMPLSDYVLSKFTPDELNIIEKNKQNILNNLKLLLDKEIFAAMNVINRKI